MHLKRLKTPKSWSINRKEYVFTTKAKPRGTLENTVPLVILLRDMLRVAKTSKEAQQILNDRKIKVNGKTRIRKHYPVTLFDIIEIPELKKSFQMTFNDKGKLFAKEVTQEFRFSRIENKTVITGGKLQLNLFDGSNVIANKTDFKTGDVVRINLKDGKIKDKIELKEGAETLIISGRHRGKSGKIIEIKNLHPKEVILESEGGNLRTRLRNAYIIG